MVQKSYPLYWFYLLSGILFITACKLPSGGSGNGLPTLAPMAAQLTQPASPAITPTPSPLLPTPQPTTVLLPTPTYAPDLADWTVMVYMDADNNLELAGLLDINEMEAAGSSEQVHVVVQIDRAAAETAVDGDWTEARRYHIRPDDNADQILSDPIASLGEVNMGDPMVLADFIGWGIRTYPANRYALIIWDHGAGWNGIAFDSAVNVPDSADHINMNDLDQALQQVLAQHSLDKLDVIGFDACLMGQLEVFQTVQPYADYAVGSEELTPGQGWDYAALLNHLYTNPTMTGDAFARQMVADFIDYYTHVEPDDFVTMAAVDLTQLPTLTHAVEVLAVNLTADPAFAASMIGDARSGAEAFARVYADEFDRYAAVDLYHFAAILAQLNLDEAITRAAQSVMSHVETAVIAYQHGAGFKNSRGIAIYFPRNSQFYNPAYGRVSKMPTWERFLMDYYQVGMAQITPPQVLIPNVLRDVVGVQNPAYLDFEVVGRDVENVVVIGGLYLEDGRRRLVEYDNLVPEPTYLADGSQISEWRDGVHEDFFVWSTTVTYLYDTEGSGEFVVMWPTDFGSTLFTVQGRYRRTAQDTYVDATLVFDHQTNQLTRVWGVQSDSSEAPAEILPQPGDEFQVYTLYLDGENEVVREPGTRLFFSAEGKLYNQWAPLPDGDYFLGFVAENVAGQTADAFIDLTIQNSDGVSGYEAYLDPYLGFQFLYPDSWYRPRYTDTLLYTANLTNTTYMQITLYPNLERGVNVEDLQAQTLELFGDVDVLFEERITVDGIGGLRTAYGYNKDDLVPHTGLFFTFIKDGTGYVVDVDGETADEAATIAAVRTMVNSWQFVQAGVGLQPGEWASIDLETFTVARPPDFIYSPLGDWQRFATQSNTFVAIRTKPATLNASDVLTALIRDASVAGGVTNFVARPAYQMPLGGAIWERTDFSYLSADSVEIWGFIMVKVTQGQEVVAWAEAPRWTYNQLESDVFLVMIADLTLTQ